MKINFDVSAFAGSRICCFWRAEVTRWHEKFCWNLRLGP